MEEGHAKRKGGSEQLVAASESWSASSELPSMEPKVLKHTARADAFVSQRAPPRAPALATHGLNVCCKKTNRAPQRTYLLASVTL